MKHVKTHRLPDAAQHELDAMIARHGVGGVERRLKIAPSIVDALAYGGKGTPRAVEHCIEALARWRLEAT